MSLEEDIRDEIRFHLEMRTEANLRAGMSPEEARADAERRFGDQDLVRQAGTKYLPESETSGSFPGSLAAIHKGRKSLWNGLLTWLSILRRDLGLGVRMLLRHPATTIAAILSLALGIGANTANFSIVYGILFRPLPFHDAEELVFVDAWNPERGDGDAPITWADLEALRQSGLFSEEGAFQTRSFTLTGSDRPERIAGAGVTPELFRALGVQPAVGRLFTRSEARESGFEEVALISHGLWNRLFSADPDVLGKTIHVNGREIVIAGVMPPNFRFPEREDLWLPLGTDDPVDHERRSIIGILRLRDGASLSAAQDAAERWSAQASLDYPDSHQGWDLRVQPLRNGWINAGGRQALSLLLAAVGFVLLLACANVANLLLARASDRQSELAVRSALGAGGGRLAHQVLVEGLVLGLAGGAGGILVSWLWLSSFARGIPEEMTYWMRIGMDLPILLYALAITVGTSLLFAILPAVRASRANLGRQVRSGARNLLGGRGHTRSLLVVAEVSLAVVLLASATFMVRTFMALQAADPGFPDTHLLSLRIVQSGDRYDDPAIRGEYFRAVRERLGSLPGAGAAVATSAIPADDGGSPIRVVPEGTPQDQALYASAIFSTRGLFETLGVELLAGRTFTASEELDPNADVAILGSRLAGRLWPGEDPLGRILEVQEEGSFRVIGVAPDLQYEEFGEDLEGARLQVHLPYGMAANRRMSILVRAAGDPAGLVAPVRDALAGLDPTLAPFEILTMPERRALTTWEYRLIGRSFGVFGGMALVLALCGIYGVIAYTVARRTREIGIRIALGARPRAVRGRVVRDAVMLAAVGAAIGLVGAVAFGRALQGILFGVSPTDPRIFGAVVAGMLASAALAGWIPARRASKVDPTEALQAE